jgi:hypothetical protein
LPVFAEQALGQGVFGIAIGATMREITATIREFPAERVPIRPLSDRPEAVTPQSDLSQDCKASAHSVMRPDDRSTSAKG